MLTNPPTTTRPTPCDRCGGEGRTECFEDRFSPRSGHWTREWTEECGECGGTGEEPEHTDCDCDRCIAAYDLAHPDDAAIAA